MADALNIGTMILFISPIVVGFGAFLGIWVKEEFYKEQFYDYDKKD